MGEVTDPEILKLLNGTGGKEVADPHVLRQLNGEEEPSSTMDFLKTLPSAAVRGFTGFLGGASKSQDVTGMSPKQIEALPTAEQMPGPEEFTGAVEKNLTGPLYQPQTGAGEYGEAVGEALGNPLSWVGPGGVISKTVGNVAGALGGKAGSELAKGSAFEIPAALAGSLLGSHTALGAPRIGAPLKSLPADRQALVDALKKEGITDLTAGQQRGNEGLTRMETLAGNSLFAGNKAQNVSESQKSQLVQSLLRRMGNSTDKAGTPDVMGEIHDRLSEGLHDVGGRLKVNFDKKLGDDLVGIEQKLFSEGLPAEEVNRITKNLENVRTGFQTKNAPAPAGRRGDLNRPVHPDVLEAMRAEAPGGQVGQGLADQLAQGVANANAAGTGVASKGVMSGKTYQALTRKGEALERLTSSANTNEAHYGGLIRQALDDAMYRTATGRGTREGTGLRQAVKDLAELRRQWRTMVITNKALAGGGADAAKGLISPAQLRMALTSTPKDKLSYSRSSGSQGLNDLSRAANAIMTPLPNSGTPAGMQALENLNLASTLRGVGEGAKATAGGVAGGAMFGPIGAAVGALGVPLTHGLIGRALHSEPVRNYLTNQLPAQKWIAEHRPGASPAWLSMVNVLRKQPNSAEAQQ